MSGLGWGYQGARGRSRTPGFIDYKASRPASLAGKVLHLKPGIGVWEDSGRTTVPDDGDSIYYWDDQSGAGNHMMQATADNRPLFQTGIVGSYAAVEFDGTNDLLSVAAALCTQTTGTVFLVPYLSSNSEHGVMFGVGGADTNGWKVGVGASNLETNGNDLIILHDGVRWIDTNTTIGTGAHVITVQYSGGTPYAWIDGVSVGNIGGLGAVAPSAVSYLGGDGATAARYYTDQLLEVVVSSLAVTSAQRTGMETFLMRKYGV